jgi:Uma2 family endonuclease
MDVATATAWQRALQDPRLQDLPYKIETNAHGQLVLSPHKPQHSFLQSRLLRLLVEHIDEAGEPTIEFAVDTAEGVKVPDVVWISDDRRRQIPDDAEASPVMPELVVEVRSAANTDAEIAAKRRLYLDEGAEEVWVCDTEGTLTFFDTNGERATSALVPSMPKTLPER